MLNIGSACERRRQSCASRLGASLFLSLTLWGAGLAGAWSQQLPTSPPPAVQLPASGGKSSTFFSKRTPYEFWLTCIIILLGVFVIVVLMRGVGRISTHRPDDISRPVIIVTIVTGTLILVTAGYSNEQIAPAFGLFGTIIGYILGRIGPAAAARDATYDGAAVKSETKPSPIGGMR